MRKYWESKATRIMMATVPHVTSGSGLRKFQADGFLLDRVYTGSAKAHRHSFLISTLYRLSDRSASRSGRYTDDETLPGTQWLGVPQGRVRRFEETKNLFFLPVIEPQAVNPYTGHNAIPDLTSSEFSLNDHSCSLLHFILNYYDLRIWNSVNK